MVLRDNRRAQERRAIGREMLPLSECRVCAIWEKWLKLTAGVSWAQGWSLLLILTPWWEAGFVTWLFGENKFLNLAFPGWFTRWQFPCHWTRSLGLKYSQHVNALQAVTGAMTSLPSNFSLFWSQSRSWGGEQQEARRREDILGSCRKAV